MNYQLNAVNVSNLFLQLNNDAGRGRHDRSAVAAMSRYLTQHSAFVLQHIICSSVTYSLSVDDLTGTVCTCVLPIDGSRARQSSLHDLSSHARPCFLRPVCSGVPPTRVRVKGGRPRPAPGTGLGRAPALAARHACLNTGYPAPPVSTPAASPHRF